MTRTLLISTGGSRKALNWQQVTYAIDQLFEWLKTPNRGIETVAEYMSMKKSKQDDLKDVGGFVGGSLSGGRRKATNVTGRSVVTLDFDNIPNGQTDAILQRVEAMDYCYCIYSTRKHTPTAPRLRVLFPSDRDMTPDEYEPCARKLAAYIGIEMVDPTTFEVSRLMYYDPDKEYKFSTYLTLTLKSAFAEASGTRSERQKRNALMRIVSLDAPLGGDEDNDLLVDMIADPDAEAPFDRLALSEEQQMIREVLSDAAERLLSIKQRMVFNEMLAADQCVTAVASANGMSVQVVSRLKNEAFWKLKTDAQVQKLYAYVFGLEDDLSSESLSGTGLTSFKNTGLSVVERVTFRRMGIGMGKSVPRINTGAEWETGATRQMGDRR